MLEQKETEEIERLVAQTTRPALNLTFGLIAVLRRKGVLSNSDLEEMAKLVPLDKKSAKGPENHAVSSAVIHFLQALRDGPRSEA